MNIKRKIIWGLIIVLLFTMFACGKKNRWQEQYDLGVRFLSEGNYQEAIIAFTAAIEIDPKQPLPYIGRGDAYISSGENDQNLTAAQADYEAATALDEVNADAWLGLADVHIRRGDYDKAKGVLEQALEKTENDPAIADKLAQVESGNILDSSGRERRRSSYDANDVLLWWHDFTYNEQGSPDSITAYDGDGNQTSHIDFAYDERGSVLTSYNFTTIDGVLSKVEHEYDASGNEVKTFYYENNGELQRYTQSTYNAEGEVIREDTFSPHGVLISYDLREYNEKGDRIKLISYDAAGALRYYQLWTYDEDGKIMEYLSYNDIDVLEWKYVYIYDEHGTLIRIEEYDGEGNLTQIQTY